jgi:pimeloyl-ACP methyl ester carboxylesterase
MSCPDFNQPDFSTLTVSRMLEQLEETIAELPPDDVVLVGSSLGGFVAVEATGRLMNDARHPINRLILLAPAVELDWDRWSELQPGGVEEWRRRGHVDVFHYAYEQPRRLNVEFYEDARQYRPRQRQVPQPMLIFQGRQDESVDPATVTGFAREHPRAILYLLDDGHQLKNSLDFIWKKVAQALALEP